MNLEKSSEPVWTVREILNWTTKRFSELEFPTPLLDAQLLLGHVLSLKKVELYIQMERPLSALERSSMRELVRRHMAGEPVAYLLQTKAWHDLDLFVDKRVLIPRPETETLLDFILASWVHETQKPTVIFDFCTGSGCLAIALARVFPEAQVVAVDVSQDALDVAILNSEKYNLGNIEFVLADLNKSETYETLKAKFGPSNIIVANPPYVSESEWQLCDVSVKDFEPKVALVAAEEGLSIGKQILKHILAKELLALKSSFAMELGTTHPTQIISSVLNFNGKVFAQNHAHWQMPQGEFFALRDIDGKERFLCQMTGLNLIKPEEPETPEELLEETQEPEE